VVVHHNMFRTSLGRFSAAAEAAEGTAAAAPLQKYHIVTRWFHLVSGAGMVTCVGTILAATNLYPEWSKCNKEQTAAKGNLLFWHKSTGLAMLFVAWPRTVMRLMYPRPAHLGSSLEGTLASLSHVLMQAFVVVLPTSGFLMSYYGPYGLPFFVTTFKPKSGEFGKAADAQFSSFAHTIHVNAGLALEYMLPIHVAGATKFALIDKIPVFSRINPLVA